MDTPVRAHTRSPARPAEADTAARLALCETLLGTDDPAECARAAVDWLAAHAGVKRGICAIIDARGGRLQGVAATGVQRAELQSVDIGLEEEEHPLVFALAGPRPVRVEDASRTGASGPAGFLAVPLPLSERREARVGLLLVSPAGTTLDPRVRWCAELLGQKLARCQSVASLRDAEHRQEQERDLFVSVIDASPDPILLTDTEGRIIVSNGRADALFSAREGESEGRRRAVQMNNMLYSAALSQRAIDDSGSARRELLLVDPSEGSDLLFELISSTVEHPRQGTCIVSILRNVTDLRYATEQIEENFRRLKVAEADVRAERDRLDLIIDSVADPILVTDPGGKILLMNAPAERLLSVPDPDKAGAERAVRSNDAHFSSFVSNLFLSGPGLRWRGELALSDPQTLAPLPVEAVAGKVLSEHGEVTAVVTILHDRAEALEKARLYEEVQAARERLEEKVREATAELMRQNDLLHRQALELEQASQLKSQFLANMSHEFRTPLNAILGYTSMLLAGISGDIQGPARQKLQRVDSNARHLLSIINDILDISRIEAGKMPVHVDEFDVAALVGELHAAVEPLIQKAKLLVTTDLDPHLPTLVSDRQKVKQIVLNLLTNAIKFTPQGTIRLIVRYDDSDKEMAISVEDTGIGIPEQDRLTVFEDFRQADNSVTREYGGAGLGLAICKRLAGMLGGRIELESQPGRGSTFTLLVPRKGKAR